VKNMNFLIDHSRSVGYKYHIIHDRPQKWESPLEDKHQQPKQHTPLMKNVKLNLSRKAGFSLVEMLVVIAIIGIIAAIAIPNIGTINDSAREATAKRNAQSIASVVNAALAAGAEFDTAPAAGAAGAATIITEAVSGLSPDTGPFRGKNFSIGTMAAEDQTAAAAYLGWDATNKQVTYNGALNMTNP
jgi:prepilin-type N-terminal cleavage/methylation domain-containing protein